MQPYGPPSLSLFSLWLFNLYQNDAHRRGQNKIANSLSAIVTYCIFEKKLAIDVNPVNDEQLSIFLILFRTHVTLIIRGHLAYPCHLKYLFKNSS